MNIATTSAPPMPVVMVQPGFDPAAESEDDSLDIGSLLTVLRAGLWWILAGTMLGLALGWFYAWAATPVYESDALVQVEQDDNSKSLNAALGDMAEALGQKAPTVAEIEILKSRMVVGKMVNALGLDIQASPAYLPVIGEAMARSHAGAGRPVPAFLGLTDYAWGGEQIEVTTLDVPTRYIDRPFELVAGSAGRYELYFQKMHLLSGRAGALSQQTLPAGDRISVFVRTLVARPGTRFVASRLTEARATKRITDFLTVTERGKQSGIIGLTYENTRPEMAQQVLNQILNAYQRQNVERKSADAAQTLVFLQQQLPDIKQKVERAESALKDYQERQGSSDLPEETTQMLKQEVSIESTRLDLVQKRQEALRLFTPDHPAVRTIDEQMSKVQGELDRLDTRARSLPGTQKELLSLKRDLEVNTTLYTNLLNSYQQLQVAKAGTIGNARIIDYAVLPNQAVRPRKAQILGLSAILGLMAGMGVVFLRRALHKGVEDPAEVERRLSLPTYAAIPYVRAQAQISKRTRQRQQQVLPILALFDPNNVAVESLRSLRTSLHFAMLEASNNIIMLTGPSPGLGKSFTSVNLGAVLAGAGKSVVLVDADMRRGYLHEYSQGSRTPGLSEYIAGQAELDAVLRPTAVSSLMIVSTGEKPPNPSELLLHPRFKALLDELSRCFDYVMIDTAPVLAVTDASIVGALAGTTMLVLKAGEHDLRSIEEAVRRLRQGGGTVRGTIFNQMGRSGHSYSYRQGYQYGYNYNYRAQKGT